MFDVFREKKKKKQGQKVDTTGKQPVIRVSICTGEQTAGFRDEKTGVFEDVCCIRSEEDLEAFRKTYGITGEIQKIY